MSFDKRLDLITSLREAAGSGVFTGIEVEDVIPTDDGVLIKSRSVRAGVAKQHALRVENLVVATGRLGGIRVLRWLGSASKIFRRLEIGVRLEQDRDVFFLRDASSLDPKLISGNGKQGVEWRTFCCCRAGEVVEVLSDAVLAVAGRSDVTPTGSSNVAFHARIMDPILGAKMCGALLPQLERHGRTFRLEAQSLEAE